MTSINPPAPHIDGAALLDQVEAFHRRFNVFPLQAAYVAVTLWDAHAHLVDCFETTPRIAFLSPEPASGKSRALEIVETLTPNAVSTESASANALYRLIEGPAGLPTVLFDEVDTIFGPKAGDNEPLRGFLNSGYRRIGGAIRCVGEGSKQEATTFSSFCAVAMAGLGSLPDTILTRSVIIRMRRRAPNEEVEPYRQRIHEKQGHALREQLAEWADTVRDLVANAWPQMPHGVTDRPADVWEPLLAIADAAGGQWPERARAACVELIQSAAASDKMSMGIRLLTDLRDHVLNGIDRLPTVAVLDRLYALDEAPWADMGGRPLGPRGLAKMLSEYVTADNTPIAPRNIKTGASVLKGYYAADMADAWQRYCPPPPGNTATSATAATAQVSGLNQVAQRRISPATPTPLPATPSPLPGSAAPRR
ncbi:DUF3631 domain-containing protein [Streptomyces sp. NPDC058657]|uniref:DUF3631 domain-containing protein n=1 Tax=unclassified Streptomyces TaxID=2593676 RepID=UPI0036656595